MQDIDVTAPAPPAGAPKARLDTALTVLTWLLVLTIVGLGGWFGYSVWAMRQSQRLSTPALRAIDGLKAQARRAPANVAIRIRLGEAYATAGLYDEAVEQLNQALKLDPKHTGALLDLGMLAMQREEFKTAEPYFKKVVELTDSVDYSNINQQRETALYYLGQIAMKQKRWEDAIAWFKAALRIRSTASDTYLEMSAAYEGMGDLDAALKQVEIALKFDPNYAQAYYKMGELYAAKKDTVNAATNFAKSAELAPDAEEPKEALASYGTAEDWRGKAMEALQKNELDTAIDAVLVARVLEPKDVSLAKLQAQIAEKKGDREGALSILKEALQLSPEDKDIKAAIARLSETGS